MAAARPNGYGPKRLLAKRDIVVEAAREWYQRRNREPIVFAEGEDGLLCAVEDLLNTEREVARRNGESGPADSGIPGVYPGRVLENARRRP
jgi:hypothetical protein